ncbi:hypothetical protein L228DRAFT_165066 [Xylona heveae TC161]|uniref:Uncharacterized protein n=1 Tax=Xylona heveae (strain CBS 132557 / TC161) TaxID=1328760 RepID=A0A165FIQ4_XYLHT|nr:hypothetical protein L228DRAFT_165066 [Xylona heveae TC161]KZF21024.1 hypothetical protein L228DRAFT_165066 [Xylona heveae TC161]
METPNYFSRPDFLNNTEESIPNNAFRNPGNLKQTLAAKPHKPGFKSEPSNDVSLDANHAQAARLSGQMMTSYLPAGNSEYATPSYQRPLLRENANMREGTINDGYQGRGQSQQRSTRARTRNTQLKPLAKETIVIDVDADEDDDEVQILNESPIKVPRKSERSQVPSRLAPSIKRPIELKQEETVTETKVRPLLASVKTSPRRPEARRSPNAASEAVNQRRSLDSDTLLGLYSKQRDSEKQEAVAIQEKLKAELLSTQQECGHFQFELDKARREKDEYRNEVNKSSTILSNYRERISQLEKFLKGLASDRDSLRNEGNDIQRLCLEMEGAKEDYAGDLQAIKQSAGLWETFRARGWEIYVRSLTEARCHIDNLQQQINLQQQQLEDSVGRLAEARDQNLDLEKRNKQNMDLYKDLVGMLDMGNINILAKLGEIRQEVQEKGLNDFYGEKLEECFSLLQHLDDTKEESRKAIEQVNASVSCVSGDMKDNFQTLLEHQTDIRQDQQDHASLMKDDIQSLKYQKQTESRLVQETTDLREQKAIIEERLAAKEREVVDLREHLSHAESLFEKRTGRLNHDISVLKSESEEAERIKAELDEARQKHDLLQGEVAKAQEMLEFRIQQEEIKIEEMRSLKRLYQISQDELNEAHLKIDNLERERDGVRYSRSSVWSITQLT